MTDFEDWSPWLQISFVIVPFVLAMLGVAFNLLIVYSRDFHIAISSINSNPYLEQMKIVWGGGSLKSRFLLLVTVSVLVTFPSMHLRKGRLDEVELKRFPWRLKRKLNAVVWLNLISVSWLIIAYVMIRNEG
ncbi:hypothetical protein [Pseudomonas sp. BN607]|uniref:hypothetical protein n=1 Tax=Pseudomonas sp. BN607 TaxID=2567895 RepID=UPI002457F288|nr:hypothetical protein [Pseudomonas sp. BN607]MDH4549115.1 hypothetical protein [Pseudomonas sp. BN607]